MLHGMPVWISDEKGVVCPSVCLSNMRNVTKWKTDLSRCLYRTKDHLAQFS